ncbi:MAG: hypothetical protein ACYDHN_08685 [Solirubrobacteraceae bacterium]
MSRALKRKLALLVAVAAIGSGGAIAAVAATGQRDGAGGGSARHSEHRRVGRMLEAAAGYLDIPVAQLKSELQSGKTLAQIADATAGKSQAGLIQTLVAVRKTELTKTAAGLAKHIGAEVNRPFPGTGAARVRDERGAHAAVRTAVRNYLGLSSTQLRSELRSGKTLAQIADATPGKSEVGLIDAIVAAIQSRRSSSALDAGKPTNRADESAQLARLGKRVKTIVNRTLGAGRSSGARTKTSR